MRIKIRKGDFKWTNNKKNKVKFIANPSGKFTVIDGIPIIKLNLL